MKRVIIALLCAGSLLAAPSKELSVIDANVYMNMQQDDAARAYNSNISEQFNEHIELAPSATFNKNNYFESELIVLNIAIKSSSKQEFSPEIAIGTNTNMKLLKVEKFNFSNGTYYSKAYLKPLNANAQVSSIDVKLFRASSEIANAKLNLTTPQITPLPHDKDFSGVVAQRLEFSNFKCSPYDDESIICSANLATSMGVLDSFKIKGALSASLSANNHDYEANKAYAAMILPLSFKTLEFSYFNPQSASYERIKAQIEVASEDVSTQSDLAPNFKELNFTVQLVCLVLAIICVAVVVYFRRFYGLLALAVILAGVGLVGQTSFKSATLEANSIVKILPTEEATVFERTSSAAVVKILNEYKDYKKIQLPNDKIGWVKSERLKD